jgi:hypothetical protein
MDAQTKDAILAVLTGQKGHYIAIASMTAEIVALRETVRGLDPTFSDVMEVKRLQAFQEDDAVRTSILGSYDELIRRVTVM